MNPKLGAQKRLIAPKDHLRRRIAIEKSTFYNSSAKIYASSWALYLMKMAIAKIMSGKTACDNLVESIG